MFFVAVSFLLSQGMIASHDFERKVKDVKKYLEKGDIVKVRQPFFLLFSFFFFCSGWTDGINTSTVTSCSLSIFLYLSLNFYLYFCFARDHLCLSAIVLASASRLVSSDRTDSMSHKIIPLLYPISCFIFISITTWHAYPIPFSRWF